MASKSAGQRRAAGGNLAGVQMLRGLAAAGVLVHHALEASNGLPETARITPDWLVTSGAAGVDIFFVISGFIMIHVGFRGDRVVGPGRFLWHRVLRIYPFYWLCCVAILGIHMVGLLDRMDTSGGAVLRSLLLLPNDAHLLGIAWTLVYEMYFYLLFATTLVLRDRTATVLGCMAFLGVGMMVAGLVTDPALARFLANPIVFEFGFGMVLALAHARGWLPHVPSWVAIGAGMLALAVLIVAAIWVPHEGTHGLEGWARVWAWGLPSAVLLVSVLAVTQPQRRSGRWAVSLGDASYALYLTHVFVVIGYSFLIQRGLLDAVPQVVSVAVISLISVAVAVLAHLWIEKPLNDLLRRKPRSEARAAG